MGYEKLGDEYLLLKELGVGGYATVYKAKNLRYGYIRAIRVLEAHVESEEDKIYQNFLRECRVLLRLGNGSHPHIVRLYQPRHVAGRAFVEMDWVDGEDLRQLIERHGGKVPVEETMRMLREIGSALSYCHREIYKVCYDRESDNLEDADDGTALITPEEERRLIEKYRVIHNDIHTGNIMRRRDGAYILLDFGLAVDGKGDVVASSRRQQGAVEFKSPARSEGMQPTPEDDIYSFGCVLYAMLTGKPPFPVKGGVLSDAECYRVFNAHKNEAPPPIERDGVPQWLKDMVMRCLAKNPADRYADGYELYQEVLRHTEGESTPSEGAAQCAREKQEMMEKIVKLEQERQSIYRNLQDAQAQHANLKKQLDAKEDKIHFLEYKNSNLRRSKWVLFVIGLLVGALLAGLCAMLFVPSVRNHVAVDAVVDTLSNAAQVQNCQLEMKP